VSSSKKKYCTSNGNHSLSLDIAMVQPQGERTMDIAKLKKEMLAELDPQAKKEYGPLIRKIKTEADAKAVCSRMGLSSSDAENFIKVRS
jgi:hypothetical protein